MTALDTALESDRPRSDLHRRRRRWPWVISGVLVAVVAAAGVAIAVFQFGLPWWMGEGDRNHVYESDIGSLRYQVHVPPRYDGSTPLPVIMAIHGCGMTGYGLNSMKDTTQFNSLADREGFIVVYPTQRMFRNAINCWNSADPREQHRYSGEPALLAGVARQVVAEYNADPDHTARQAWAQMGDRARQVPLIVVQGEDDDVVPPVVATRLVEHWTAVSDLIDDGLLNGSLDLVEETTRVPSEQGRHAYTHTTITTPDDSSLVELYVVHEMGHDWPGPASEGLFTDRAGPDASAIVWDFAQRHPKGSPQ